MKNQKIAYSIDEIDSVVDCLIDALDGKSIIAMTGSLGAGKTTLSGALLKKLGVLEPVISPTFTYVNCYTTNSGLAVYHFDLYRLKSMQGFEMAGFCEYLDQPNSLVIIEWPNIIEPLIRNNSLLINIEHAGLDKRIITLRSL